MNTTKIGCRATRLMALRLCVALGFLFVSTSLSAAELSGKTIDADTRTVLRDVTVRLVPNGRATATDKEGTFRFPNLPEGDYALIASHVGYDHSDTVHVNVPSSTDIVITLKSSPWVLNDVVVTGTRSPHLLKNVPVQTEVVTPADFKRTGATTVDEALNAAIGVNINNDFSGSGATMRGVEGDRVLVMIDGERAVGRVNGSIDLSQFALTNVEKIEIVKGTGSTLYGSDAIGGVINIITRKPAYDQVRGNLYLDYGTFSSANPSLQLDYGKANFGVTAGARYYHTAGFDLDKTTRHTNGQDAIDRWNCDAKSTHRLSKKLNLVTSGRFMYEKRKWIEEGGLGDVDIVYNDRETNHRYDGSASLDYLSGDKYSMKLRLYGSLYNHLWKKFGAQYGTWVDTSDTKDKYFEASYTSNYVIGDKHVVTYGLDYAYQDLVSSELDHSKQADRSTAGYLQYEIDLFNSLTVLPGARYEHHSSFGTHFNPSFNLMYKSSDALKFRGFVGKGFRAPSIKEQYFIFDHSAAGYVVYGGEVALPPEMPQPKDYRPLLEETSINSAVSVEFSYGSIGLHRLTYYYNHLNDMIDFTLLGFTPSYWRGVYMYQNVERAYTQGIEWESRVKMLAGCDLSLSYTYLKSRNLKTGEELLNRPAHTAKVMFSAMTRDSRWGGTCWVNYESKKLWVSRSNTGEQEANPEWAPARTVISLNTFHRMGDIEAFVRLDNIFDRTNVTYGYWPGRQVFAGFKYDLSIH